MSVDPNVKEALKELVKECLDEVVDKKIESMVEDQLDEMDISRLAKEALDGHVEELDFPQMIREEMSDYDFSDDIEKGISDYDFEEIVNDSIDMDDLVEKLNRKLKSSLDFKLMVKNLMIQIRRESKRAKARREDDN